MVEIKIKSGSSGYYDEYGCRLAVGDIDCNVAKGDYINLDSRKFLVKDIVKEDICGDIHTVAYVEELVDMHRYYMSEVLQSIEELYDLKDVSKEQEEKLKDFYSDVREYFCIEDTRRG